MVLKIENMYGKGGSYVCDIDGYKLINAESQILITISDDRVRAYTIMTNIIKMFHNVDIYVVEDKYYTQCCTDNIETYEVDRSEVTFRVTLPVGMMLTNIISKRV